jgi:hypothetical protein
VKSTAELQVQQEGLWRNCADSLTHALEHFSSVNQESEPFHNRKWVILSVAHAAEVYCNLLLCVFDPNHPNNPKCHYPSLSKAREMLTGHARLSKSERLVIEKVLTPLSDQRNTLMHMPAPDMLSVSDTAVALLSLLHIIRRRTGLDSTHFLDQYPPIEQDIVDEIDWRKLEAWLGVAEQLVEEEYGEEYLKPCDNCGAIAVTPDTEQCQACFQSARH